MTCLATLAVVLGTLLCAAVILLNAKPTHIGRSK